MPENPKAQLSAMFEGKWIRIAAEALKNAAAVIPSFTEEPETITC